MCTASNTSRSECLYWRVCGCAKTLRCTFARFEKLKWKWRWRWMAIIPARNLRFEQNQDCANVRWQSENIFVYRSIIPVGFPAQDAKLSHGLAVQAVHSDEVRLSIIELIQSKISSPWLWIVLFGKCSSSRCRTGCIYRQWRIDNGSSQYQQVTFLYYQYGL